MDNGEDDSPFVSECVTRLEWETDWRKDFNNCRKNHRHKGCTPVNEFTISHLGSSLPPEMTSSDKQDLLGRIRMMWDSTARVTVNYTSPERPEKFPGTSCSYPYAYIGAEENNFTVRYATSFLDSRFYRQEGNCPCPNHDVDEGPGKGFWVGLLKTATHAVCDLREAKQAMFEFGYDSDEVENDNLMTIYGVGKHLSDFDIRENEENDQSDVTSLISYYNRIYSCRFASDINLVVCVTCDGEIANILNAMMVEREKCAPMGYVLRKKSHLLVSHPHGGPKRVSFGDFREKIPVSLKSVLDGKNRYLRAYYDSRFYQFTNVTEKLCYRVTSDTSDSLIPADAKISTPRPLCDEDLVTIADQDKDVAMIKLPQGTEIWTGNNGPNHTLFKSRLVPLKSLSVDLWFYLTYATPTCPGSSGALVLHDGHFTVLYTMHSGVQNGNSKSGIYLC